MTRGRRSRRGLALAETAAAMIIAAAVAAALAAIAGRVSDAALAQAEARAVSAAADQAARSAEADAERLIGEARGNAGGARPVGREEAGIPDAAAEETPGGRRLSWAHYAPDADTLIVIAWAEGGGGRPAPGWGISGTGRVGGAGDGCGAGRVCGPGIDWDASAALGALGPSGPRPGDMAAARWLSLARLNPGLLRRGPGPRDLHVVGAAAREIYINGRIVNVGKLDVPEALIALTGGFDPRIGRHLPGSVRTPGEARVSETAVMEKLTVAGDLVSDDWIEAGAGISGFGSISALGSPEAGEFRAVEAEEAALTVGGRAEFGDLEIGAKARPGAAGDVGQLRADRISGVSAGAARVRTERAEARGALRAADAEIGELILRVRGEAGDLRVTGELFTAGCSGC